MRRHGLHLGQNHLLAALWERDGRTPVEIAAELRVTTPTVVKMATRMAAAGLLTRRDNEATLFERGLATATPAPDDKKSDGPPASAAATQNVAIERESNS